MTDDRTRLDEVVRELASLRLQIDSATDGEHAEIVNRQDALRAEAARIRERIAPTSTSAIRSELHMLERRLRDAYKGRIDVIAQAGGGSSGGDFGFAADAAELNRHIDAASGKAEIEARIRHLRSVLAERADGD